ncbi:Asp-tRNA(Asn)/Glu-tRNA(Gln) amidotransferase subunit GatC [Sphingopyxis indica]|uniref:Aspartyl/glutamyl-tRNA(Asn/Gln) amidotransferase subunit C n=1 Tax=Sphingopyxis indica TaxID=436663 RepID=A0A239D2W0_9SPHN|nr:Asp-tRNA(Asn)/Glu-tRNA(Gln) amidotransferase subunit GatC [Sphingopyxis indica]SNS26856.1 aspartyl/glutamyl-tRNA(Asn/Gln) amidotransferase subunit C [Sphingopyxis indica]
MTIDQATVRKIASLARIAISDAEADGLAGELNNILGWVEQLGEVDVSGVEPMTAVIPNQLRLRDDVIDADPLTGGNRRDDILANAPEPQHGFFGVPKVIE